MTDLKTLLESELLSTDTKSAIKEALDSAKASIREGLEVEFAKKFVADKQAMNIKLTALIDESVKNEISELIEEVAQAKTTEVRYAKKLAEFKEEYVTKMNASISEAVTAMVDKEFSELRADILEAKKNHVFGKIVESFAEDCKSLFLTEDAAQLTETLNARTAELTEAQTNLANVKREQKLESVLSNLTGPKREVMRTILENVSIDKIEPRYNECVKAVLEDEAPAAADSTPTDDPKKKVTTAPAVEDSTEGELKEAALNALRRSAGIPLTNKNSK